MAYGVNSQATPIAYQDMRATVSTQERQGDIPVALDRLSSTSQLLETKANQLFERLRSASLCTAKCGSEKAGAPTPIRSSVAEVISGVEAKLEMLIRAIDSQLEDLQL